MGEVQDSFFEPDFNRSIKVHLTDDRITSNAGVVLLREADHALGLGEFQQAIGPHLSSREFVDNEATMLLALLAYNLSSMLRIEIEYELGSCWDLSRFQKSVLKAGGRVVKHARRLRLQVAQAVAPLWQSVIACIAQLKLPQRWAPPHGPRRRSWMPPPRHAYLHEVLRL